MDIRVIGAGCFGLSAALALAEEGHDVTVIESRQPGAGATGKAAGICSTMLLDDDDARLVAETRGRIGELISLAAGPVPEARGAWRSHDSALVAGPNQLDTLDDVQARVERMTEEPERLDWRQAGAAFPAVRFAPGEEVLVAQEDGVIDAADFLAALRWRVETEGVEITHRHGTIDGPTVVAAGAWTTRLLPELGLQCFRAQAASVQGVAEAPILHDAVHGWYMRPESDVSVVAGDGTRLTDHDPDDYNESGGPRFKETLAAALTGRLDVPEAAIRNSWAGLCVGTPDRRPLCGPVPGRAEAWVLSGDNGFGLMRCMALGERLAAAVDGDVDARLDPRRLDGSRDWQMREGFAWPQA